MKRFAQALLLGFFSLFALQSLAQVDPIVGKWTMDREFGTYTYEMSFSSDGSFTMLLFSEETRGKWRRDGAKYFVDPGGQHDYFLVKKTNRGWVLESWDNEGLIRRFRQA